MQVPCFFFVPMIKSLPTALYEIMARQGKEWNSLLAAYIIVLRMELSEYPATNGCVAPASVIPLAWLLDGWDELDHWLCHGSHDTKVCPRCQWLLLFTALVTASPVSMSCSGVGGDFL